jgi:peptide chain release factor 2
VVEFIPEEESRGIKEAVLFIKGTNAYGYLKGEAGIHRLVRISPFDANRRRHTSFASVFVLPEVSEVEVEINPVDLKIETFRASSAGGQHVNVTDSAVRITHLPTKITAQCQNERSQHRNKAMAMKVLISRLNKFYQEKEKEKLSASLEEKKKISWGNQIRSYILHPYQLVKDHRTEEQTGKVQAVLDGELDNFILAYLKSKKG